MDYRMVKRETRYACEVGAIMEPMAILLGLSVGMLVETSSIGGGSLMTPLIILLGIKPAMAVGTDVIYALLSIGGVPLALLGSILISHLGKIRPEMADFLVSKTLALILVISVIAMILQPRSSSRTSEYLNGGQTRSKPLLLFLGALIGFTVSLTSVGGGSLLPSLLATLCGLPMRKIVGTSMAFALAITAIPGLAYFSADMVNLELLTSLLVGSLPGVFVGSKLNHRASARSLNAFLTVVLAFSAASLRLKVSR